MVSSSLLAVSWAVIGWCVRCSGIKCWQWLVGHSRKTEYRMCSWKATSTCATELSHHSRFVHITGCHWIRGLFTWPAVTSFKVCSHHRLSLNSRSVHITSCHIIPGLFSSPAVTEFEVCSHHQLSHHSRSVLITSCHIIQGLFSSPVLVSLCYTRLPRALHNTTIN